MSSSNAFRSRRVLMIRHAMRLDVEQPQWVRSAPRPYDTPISDEGYEQASLVASWLAEHSRPAHIFCSPFLRAVQTAEPSIRRLGISANIEAGLAENYFPQYFPDQPLFDPWALNATGLGREGLVNLNYQPRVMPSYPETAESSTQRARQTMLRLLDEFSGDLIFFTHGGIVHGLGRALVPNASLSPVFAAIMELRSDETGRWRVVRDGTDVSHLGDRVSTVA